MVSASRILFPLRRPGASALRLVALVGLGVVWTAASLDASGEKHALDAGKVNAVPAFHAVRTTTPPVIDGNLGDEAWKGAPEISGFTQHEPNDGAPASQKTVVRVVYDDDAIYFGAMMFDEGTVTSLLGRRDVQLQSDWFRIYLDPHDDHRTGAGFWVNPANVQLDLRLYNDSWDDTDWDAVWSSAAAIVPGGWAAEVRIPFSQLRFPDRPTHTWGLNFIRSTSRTNEQDRLVNVPKNDTGFVSRFARLTGIEGVHPKRSLEILPYTVSRADLDSTISSSDPLNSTHSFRGDAGIDIKYGLTSNLTLTGTINPDFGQVEVDPASVNLTQFELFFPEKRPFFIEGSDLFEFGQGGSNNNFNFNLFPPSFFYSRRIGRSPQGTDSVDYDYLDVPEQTTILGAAKLTGKTASGWTIAALDALTDRETAEFALDGKKDHAVVEPRTNYLVLRSARDLGEKGRVGFLLTGVNRELPENLQNLRNSAYSGGIDGYWGFGKRDVILEWFAGGSVVRGSADAIEATQRSPAHYYQRPDAEHLDLDEGRTSLSGWGGRVMLAKQTGRWKYNVQAQTYSPGFETNDVGFLRRADVTATHAAILYRNPDPWKATRERSFWIGKFQNWNTAGNPTSNGIMGNSDVIFRNYWEAFYWGGYAFQVLDDRATRGGPLIRSPASYWWGGGFGTDSRRKISLQLSGETGSDELEGGYNYLEGSLVFRPTSRLSITLSPIFNESTDHLQYVSTIADADAPTFGNRYVFATIRQKSVELATRLDLTFTSTLSLQVYLQPFIASGRYSDFKELLRARSLDFRVYDHDRVTLDPVDDAYRFHPFGAAEFTVSNPDFNFRSVRGNAVLRWEFRPGSALYVVWNENRADQVSRGDFRFGRDLSRAIQAPSEDVFLIKFSYWMGL